MVRRTLKKNSSKVLSGIATCYRASIVKTIQTDTGVDKYSDRAEVQLDLNVLRNLVYDKGNISSQRGNHKLFNKWH